jgi:GNAT superfamily N-acetyltransferase
VRAALNIRQSTLADHAAINQLVTQIVTECYGHLLSNFDPNPNADWEHAWVAERNKKLIAVLRTENEWIDDLWLLKSERSAGIGNCLLRIAEQEIASHGNVLARLRLVAENTNALNFYSKHGWQHVRSFPHEKFGFEMIELSKPV